jgi:hypothetical protein
MKQRDPIGDALNAIAFKWANEDPDALLALERRIAAAARNQGLISYTDLVAGVSFQLPTVHDGRPFHITEWTDLHRAIIGDFLGLVNVRSWAEHGFLASALVVDRVEMKPSRIFFSWAQEHALGGRSSESAVLEFWVNQVKQAHAYYGK